MPDNQDSDEFSRLSVKRGLLDVPLEIRFLIYNHIQPLLLVKIEGTQVSTKNGLRNMMLVCQQLYREVLSVPSVGIELDVLESVSGFEISQLLPAHLWENVKSLIFSDEGCYLDDILDICPQIKHLTYYRTILFQYHHDATDFMRRFFERDIVSYLLESPPFSGCHVWFHEYFEELDARTLGPITLDIIWKVTPSLHLAVGIDLQKQVLIDLRVAGRIVTAPQLACSLHEPLINGLIDMADLIAEHSVKHSNCGNIGWDSDEWLGLLR